MSHYVGLDVSLKAEWLNYSTATANSAAQLYFLHPAKRLLLGKPLGGMRPAEARGPSQPVKSVTR